MKRYVNKVLFRFVFCSFFFFSKEGNLEKKRVEIT